MHTLKPGVGAAELSPLRWVRIERVVALSTVMALPVRLVVSNGITAGQLLTLITLPMWIRFLARYRAARAVAFLGVAAVASGLVLAGISSDDHQVSTSDIISVSGLILGVVGGIGVVLWARQHSDTWLIGALWGVSMAVNSTVFPGALNSANLLKFGYSMPIVIFVLGLCMRRSLRVQFFALLLLAAMCGFAQFRSLLATCLMVAVLLLWQMRPASDRRVPWPTTLVMLGVLAAGAYYTISTLLLDGYLGAGAQARSVEQVEAAGSLIVGGRPEIAASLALFRYQPYGFGIGVRPNSSDVAVASQGFLDVNYDPDNGYVRDYLFGTKFELHSTLADLWALCGPIGIAFVVAIAAIVVRGVGGRLPRRTATGLHLLLATWTMWNLVFSPILATTTTLIPALGLLLLRRVGDPDLGDITDRSSSTEDLTKQSADRRKV